MIRKLLATALLGILPFQAQANNCGTVDLIAERGPAYETLHLCDRA